MSDPVNHPKHYNAHPSGVECVDVAEHYGFNVGNAIKYTEHGGVLVGHRRAQLGEHTGRQIEPGGDRIQMAGAGAGAGADQQLVVFAGADDFVHQRKQAGAATVDHALAADFQHGGVGQDAKVSRGFGRLQQLRVSQRALHQELFQLCSGMVHGKSFSSRERLAKPAPDSIGFARVSAA